MKTVIISILLLLTLMASAQNAAKYLRIDTAMPHKGIIYFQDSFNNDAVTTFPKGWHYPEYCMKPEISIKRNDSENCCHISKNTGVYLLTDLNKRNSGDTFQVEYLFKMNDGQSNIGIGFSDVLTINIDRDDDAALRKVNSSHYLYTAAGNLEYTFNGMHRTIPLTGNTNLNNWHKITYRYSSGTVLFCIDGFCIVMNNLSVYKPYLGEVSVSGNDMSFKHFKIIGFKLR